MKKSILLTFSLFFLVQTVHPNPTPLTSDSHFSTPSGRHIPLEFLTNRLPKRLRASPKSHFFEVDSNEKTLLGPNNFKLNLNGYSNERVIQMPSGYSTPMTFVNNRKISNEDFPSFVTRRIVGDYVATYTSNELIGVTGPSMRLVPIDHGSQRGIFINVFEPLLGIDIDAEIDASEDGASFDDEDGVQPVEIIPTTRTFSKIPSFKANSSVVHSDEKIQILNNVSRQGQCSSGGKHYIEVAAAFDASLCQYYGNMANYTISLIQAAFDEANTAYIRDTCAELVLVYIDGYCDDGTLTSDPYGTSSVGDFSNIFPYATNSQAMLYRFRSTFETNNGGVSRDLTYLFTGYEDGTSTIGLAFVGVACVTTFGYGWVEYVDGMVLAHEIGHNLNAYHTSTGLMTPSKNSDSFFFAADSQQNITEFIDNAGLFCMDDTVPTCDDASCPLSCTAPGEKCGSPLVTLSEMPDGLVPCTPATDGFVYCGEKIESAFTLSYNYYSKTTCGGSEEGYSYLERTFAMNDNTIFCCLPTTDTMTTVAALKSEIGLVSAQFPDGFVRQNVLYPPQNVNESARLLKTTLIPDCILPSPSPVTTALPTPTESPTSSSSPPSAESVYPTANPQPSVFIATPASPSPQIPGVQTCADVFSESSHVQCSNSIMTATVSGVGSVRVMTWARFNKIHVLLLALNGELVNGYGLIFSESSTVVPTLTDSVTPLNSRVYIKYGTEITKLPLPASGTCCGAGGIVGRMSLNLCLSNGSGCSTETFTINVVLECGPMCDKDTTQFSPVPMSVTRRCPGCVQV